MTNPESLPGSSKFVDFCHLKERKICLLCQERICVKFFRDHLFSHFNYNPFNCRICYAEFTSERILNLHGISKHGSFKQALNFTEEELDKFVNVIFNQYQKNGSIISPKQFAQQFYPFLLSNKSLFNNLEYSCVLKMVKSNEIAANNTFVSCSPVKRPTEARTPPPPDPKNSFENSVKMNSVEISNRSTHSTYNFSQHVTTPTNEIFQSRTPTTNELKVICAKCSKSVSKLTRKSHCLQHLPDNGLEYVYKCLLCTTRGSTSLYRSNLFRLHMMQKHDIEDPRESVDFADLTKTDKYEEIMKLTLRQCFPNL